MLAKIKGILDYKDDDILIIDVNGVGYEVFVSRPLIEQFQEGNNISLLLQTIVREDSITLYGFANALDKKIFNLVTTVPGVGPRIALGMLSKMPSEQIIKSVMMQNENAFKNISGIGPKVAQRILNELKDKISKIPSVDVSSITSSNQNIAHNNIQDAVLALQGLGYTYFEINNALKKLKENVSEDSKTEDIIKMILVYFSGGG